MIINSQDSQSRFPAVFCDSHWASHRPGSRQFGFSTAAYAWPGYKTPLFISRMKNARSFSVSSAWIKLTKLRRTVVSITHLNSNASNTFLHGWRIMLSHQWWDRNYINLSLVAYAISGANNSWYERPWQSTNYNESAFMTSHVRPVNDLIIII